MKQRYILSYSEMLNAVREYLMKQGNYSVGEAGTAELSKNTLTNEFVFDYYPEE